MPLISFLVTLTSTDVITEVGLHNSIRILLSKCHIHKQRKPARNPNTRKVAILRCYDFLKLLIAEITDNLIFGLKRVYL